jgi:hypothetical protein
MPLKKIGDTNRDAERTHEGIHGFCGFHLHIEIVTLSEEVRQRSNPSFQNEARTIKSSKSSFRNEAMYSRAVQSPGKPGVRYRDERSRNWTGGRVLRVLKLRNPQQMVRLLNTCTGGKTALSRTGHEQVPVKGEADQAHDDNDVGHSCGAQNG